MNYKKYSFFILFTFLLKVALAQDYVIDFESSGAKNTIDNITVTNLTKGNSLNFSGTKFLHLKNSVETGIYSNYTAQNDELEFFPNPTKDYTQMIFETQVEGINVVEIYNISGLKLMQTKYALPEGRHTIELSGLKAGIYFINVWANGFCRNGKLICTGNDAESVNIKFLNTIIYNPVGVNTLKYAADEEILEFNSGDQLMFSFNSGDYNTILTDSPEQSKTILFNFYECRGGDSINYPVVKIGDQIWTAVNLRSVKFVDGTDIPKVDNDSVWTVTNSPAYCWYNNDSSAFSDDYGALYNWYTISTEKVCPAGWHIPNNEDWANLATYLDGNEFAGGMLKEQGYEHWNSPNLGADNYSGFTALPGGFRSNNGKYGFGKFNDIGNSATFISATEFDNENSYGISLNANHSVFQSGTARKGEGHSIRCIGPKIPIPALITNIGDITANSATSGGTIVFDGNSQIIRKGICWSDTPYPDSTDNITSDGIGTGIYTSLIEGLTPNSIYYIRAYAINEYGIGYGNEISFTTRHEVSNVVLDIDGNEYDTIRIGNQVWMKENLKTTRLNDGSEIPKVAGNFEWNALNSPGMCYYDNDAARYGQIYGALYNWYTIETERLCPTGWHVPDTSDWANLENYLGGNSIAGSKLKESGLDHWKEENNDATNETGFTALPNGFRNSGDGNYINYGYSNYLWLSDQITDTRAYFKILSCWGANIISDNGEKVLGLAVRCLKDVEK
ncbi:MAG: T9SS type A sorting domain-containing protein [Bacteroidales bacterium]|nr:T9SS type A sorting domain-containing protein [Bacteroidales bacterium]